jgi:hypothetical protein
MRVSLVLFLGLIVGTSAVPKRSLAPKDRGGQAGKVEAESRRQLQRNRELVRQRLEEERLARKS